MTLDYIERLYNVRERGNRVQIVHMERPQFDLHYVSIRDLDGDSYVHRGGSSVGCGGDRYAAERLAKELYEREAAGGEQ